MESSQASDYHEKLQLNSSEKFPGELQITLQLGSRWAFEATYINSSLSKSKSCWPDIHTHPTPA